MVVVEDQEQCHVEKDEYKRDNHVVKIMTIRHSGRESVPDRYPAGKRFFYLIDNERFVKTPLCVFT